MVLYGQMTHGGTNYQTDTSTHDDQDSYVYAHVYDCRIYSSSTQQGLVEAQGGGAPWGEQR